jgi:LysM repeat protein
VAHRAGDPRLGERWKEIADLNYGVEQADGWSLTPENWLNAGWVLTLPSDAPSGASSSPETTVETTTVEKEVTVVSGDTLWAIAEQELGDGNRYPEIFDATKDDVQPDGRHLTDPDLIYPGWVVDVPVTVETTVPVAPPAETGGVEDVAPGAGTSETGADAGASSLVDEAQGRRPTSTSSPGVLSERSPAPPPPRRCGRRDDRTGARGRAGGGRPGRHRLDRRDLQRAHRRRSRGSRPPVCWCSSVCGA